MGNSVHSRKLPLILPAGIVLMVAMSRLYLGAHYLMDVAAAVVLGVAFVPAYLKLWDVVSGWLHRRSALFYAGATVIAAGGVLASIFLRVDTPRRWEILGLVLGAGFALILERQVLGYRPPPFPRGCVLAATVGIGGFMAIAAAIRLMGPAPMWIHVGLAFGLVSWAVLGAPAVASLLTGDHGPGA